MSPDIIPNTAPYLYLGLAAIVVIMGVFVVGLVARTRGIQRELQQIEVMSAERK
jgi:hypothetical protein